MAKNARFLELGPANVYLYPLPKASLNIGTPPYAGIHVKAVLGGLDGNDITVALVDPGTSNSPLSVSVTDTDIVVSLETGAPYGTTLISTADEVIFALENDPAAAFLVTAARAIGEPGTGVMAAAAAASLTGGSATGTKTDVGFLGEGLVYQVTTEVGNLTGAQTGNVAQDKVIIGGMAKVVLPFKEITMDNFKVAVPMTRLVENADGSRRRLDFAVKVGLSMRSQAMKMSIHKIKGGFESALAEDIIVIPEISPAEGEVSLPYAPTTQREILSNWYAWPHEATGRWVFLGNELP